MISRIFRVVVAVAAATVVVVTTVGGSRDGTLPPDVPASWSSTASPAPTDTTPAGF